MKKLLVTVVILSLATVACEAFKDSYDQDLGQPIVNNANLADPSGADFSTDTTVCQVVDGVTATASESSGVVKESALSTADSGAAVKAVAESIGDFTTRITVSAGDESVSFTIKQGEKGLSVCSATYGQMKVVKGEIIVDTFSAGLVEDATKAVSSGTFSLEFKSDGSAMPALKAIKDLAGGDAADDGTVKVEGSYFVTGITDLLAK